MLLPITLSSCEFRTFLEIPISEKEKEVFEIIKE